LRILNQFFTHLLYVLSTLDYRFYSVISNFNEVRPY